MVAFLSSPYLKYLIFQGVILSVFVIIQIQNPCNDMKIGLSKCPDSNVLHYKREIILRFLLDIFYTDRNQTEILLYIKLVFNNAISQPMTYHLRNGRAAKNR